MIKTNNTPQLNSTHFKNRNKNINCHYDRDTLKQLVKIGVYRREESDIDWSKYEPQNFDNRGFGEYVGLGKLDLYDERNYIDGTMTQYEFFKYYFTPTEYINVENLVDVDTVRIY